MKLTVINHKFTMPVSKRSRTETVVIHHSASADVSAATIHQWHLKRGWLGIGYHFVIRADGTIETGRPIDTVGAHAGTSANHSSIGICVAGDFDKPFEYPTPEQIGSLVYLVKEYIYPVYGEVEITGHGDHKATACPGKNFPMKTVIERVKVQDIKLIVNGIRMYIPLKNEGGRIYVLLNGQGQERHWIQIRALADALGAKLEWEQGTQTITLTTSGGGI